VRAAVEMADADETEAAMLEVAIRASRAQG